MKVRLYSRQKSFHVAEARESISFILISITILLQVMPKKKKTAKYSSALYVMKREKGNEIV